MATPVEDFRFGPFVASVVWLLFWVLIIVTVIVLPLIFVILFYVPLPLVNGEVLTPYLFLSMMVDPTRTLPILNFLIYTEFFKVAVFPGFMYACTHCSCHNIHRKEVSCQNAAKSRSISCRTRGFRDWL